MLKMNRCIETENHVELYFDDIPDYSTRESLKVCGWKWNHERKCWRTFRSDDNVKMAKELCQSMNPKPKSKLHELPQHVVEVNDIFVRSNGFYCGLNHRTIDMAGLFIVTDKRGLRHQYLAPIVWCSSCARYFILEETFTYLKRQGIINCQIMTEKQYREKENVALNPMLWRDYSPLRMWGYTVSKAEGLSDEQRHQILEMILDHDALSKDRLLSYLDFFIKNIYNSYDATDKWKSDRQYIAEYKIGSRPKVTTGNIITVDIEYR